MMVNHTAATFKLRVSDHSSVLALPQAFWKSETEVISGGGTALWGPRVPELATSCVWKH